MLSIETRKKMSEARIRFENQHPQGSIHRGLPYNGKWYKGKLIPSHPNAKKNGVIEEHRLIASKALGKPLPDGVIVHHPEKGFDNGCLVICQDVSYHMLLHVRQRAYEATGDPHVRKCSFCQQWDYPDNMKKSVQKMRKRNESYYHRECHADYCHKKYGVKN